MRHQVYGRHLGRTSAHRRALKRNLTASLFEHGTIATTPQKAKFVKPFAEKMITLAKRGTLHARRQIISHLQNRDICQEENGEPVKVDTVIDKLFNEIAPNFSDRSGGYTRIIKLPLRRIGDNGQLVFLQLVSENVTAKSAPVVEAEEVATDVVETEVEEKVEEAPAVATAQADEPEATDESTQEQPSEETPQEESIGEADQEDNVDKTFENEDEDKPSKDA